VINRTVISPKQITSFLKSSIDDFFPVIDDWLHRLLPSENDKPELVHSAMRYSVFAGGKRLRPFLVYKAFKWVGGDGNIIFPPACAIEFIHTYSLIHDDLPAMDNDDLRRGKPTCHRVFGEAVAILAGDALHALAFKLLAETGNAKIVYETANAIGSNGLVGGQVVDVEMEGQNVDEENVYYIHSRKTAALFIASVRVGAILAGASEKQLNSLTNYAKNIGIAFQITDDILDIMGETEKIGKPAGSDIELDKATYPKAIGLDKSKKVAAKLIDKAINSLLNHRDNRIFVDLANYILNRTN